MPETAQKIALKTAEKSGKNLEKTSNSGHLRVTVAGILLSASGPFTVSNIRRALEAEGYYNVKHHTITSILSDIACDNTRVLSVAPMRVGPKKVPADGYQLKEKSQQR